MTPKKFLWTIKLDWLNILNKLGLSSIHQIKELTQTIALENLTEKFGSEQLLTFECKELEALVSDELDVLLKKERSTSKKSSKKSKKPRDPSDLFPSNVIKIRGSSKLAKELMRAMEEMQDPEDEDDDIREDNTGYYI